MSASEAGAGASKRARLEQVSVPRLLFALLRQRFSGTMGVEQPPPNAGPRTVWFRGGMPVFTDWVAPAEVLGQVLLSHRIVDEAQLLRGLQSMAAQGGRLGEHLLAAGVIDRPALLEGLRQQCMRKLAQLFALRVGEVTVTPGDGGGVDDDLLSLNVLGLILAAVGVTYDEVRVEAEMGPALHGPLQITGALARYRSHFGFRPGDEPLLQALEQPSALAQLASSTGAGLRRAAQVVYTLWACQMLRTGSAAETAAPRSSVPTPVPARPRQAAPTPVPPSRRTDDDMPVATPPAAADDDFEAELEALEAKVSKGVHAFELFGLPLTATKRDVRKVWADLSRKFHPDALQSQGRGHLSDRVNGVFAALSEAQQLLGDAEQRDELRAAIEKGEHESAKDGQDATARAHAVFQSELMAKEADKLLRANRFDRALERYREAAKYDPDEPDLTAAVAWCEYQLSPKGPADVARVKASLMQVTELAPRLARAHHFLGFVLSDEGKVSAAIDSFRRAARLDPRLIDAERQARALELRTGHARTGPHAAVEGKGLRSGLKGLLRKK